MVRRLLAGGIALTALIAAHTPSVRACQPGTGCVPAYESGAPGDYKRGSSWNFREVFDDYRVVYIGVTNPGEDPQLSQVRVVKGDDMQASEIYVKKEHACNVPEGVTVHAMDLSNPVHSEIWKDLSADALRLYTEARSE